MMFNRKEKKKYTGWKQDLRTIVEGLLIALIIRSFIIQPFNIPSGSMYPTLVIGDYVFVTKYSYGYSRYSVPFGRYWLPDFGRAVEMSPTQGDVSVFRVLNNDIDFIKRVVGMPGDTVQMRNGRLYINGKKLHRKRIADSIINDTSIATYIETLPNGVKHKIWEADGDKSPYSDNTEEFTVPQEHYFMMGDNRDRSDDSRFPRVRFVAIDTFVGEAKFIGWSLGNASTWQVWKWYNQGTLKRLGKVID